MKSQKLSFKTYNLPKLYKECFKERKSENRIEEHRVYMGREALTCDAGVAVIFNAEARYKGY